MSPPAAELPLTERIAQAIDGVTPGVRLCAFRNGQSICEVNVGATADFYDLASLTKVVFTQQALMRTFDTGLWSTESRVGDWLPDFPHGALRLVDLMTHTSGMFWWKPFFESIRLQASIAEKRVWLLRELGRSELLPAAKAVYSDLGFMLLGYVLERMHGADLLTVWNRLLADAYAQTTLAMHPDNRPQFARQRYAPTEACPWRRQRLQGEVHDDNTWALGGVSTHAGLFGSLQDVSAFGLMLRDQMLALSASALRPGVARNFAQRAIAAERGDWALGFMLPSAVGSSCGSYLSPESVGHTGFTGTSLWFDPRNDLLVVILSNRVALGRENRRFLDLRPQLHDWVCELLCPDMAKCR